MLTARNVSHSSLAIRDPEQAAGPGSPKKANAIADKTTTLEAVVTRPQSPLEKGDHGRWRALGLRILGRGMDPVPVYTDTITSKVNLRGNKTFYGQYGAVKSLVNFAHREEVRGNLYPDNSLHDLIGKKGVQITLTAVPEIKTMLQVLRQIFSPTDVNMMKSKKDRHLQTEQMDGDVLTAQLYDQMELGGSVFGPRTLTIADSDAEAGPREVTIPEYLQTFKLDVECDNPEVSRRILDQLKLNPGLVADMQAELIRRMANKKSVSNKMLIGFGMSGGISASTGAFYEYVISAIGLKPLLPGAKKLIEAAPGIPKEEVGKTVIKAAPHLLPGKSKAGALFIDDVPPGAIEVLDTLGALWMKSGSGNDTAGLPGVEIDRSGESLAVQVLPFGTAKEEEKESLGEKMGGALKGGGISMVMALPALTLGYFKPETTLEKALTAVGAVLAELSQVTGATAGVSIELREDYTKAKAQILQLIREEIIAPAPEGVSEQSYVEGKARRQIARSSATSTAQAAIGSGMLLAAMTAALGVYALNVMSEEEARPYKSAVYQPWEAIGMMIITLAAMHLGLPSRLGQFFFSNDEQKSSQRLATILDKHGKDQKLTPVDNLLIDRPFLSLLGQGSVAAMAKICVGAIKGGEEVGLWNDLRDEARIPYANRNPIAEQELVEVEQALRDNPELAASLAEQLDRVAESLSRPQEAHVVGQDESGSVEREFITPTALERLIKKQK